MKSRERLREEAHGQSTGGDTLLATSALLAAETAPEAPEEDEAVVRDVVEHVAERLGNTPAGTKGSYITPWVFAALEDGVTIPEVRSAVTRMRPRKYLTIEEPRVLKVLLRR